MSYLVNPSVRHEQKLPRLAQFVGGYEILLNFYFNKLFKNFI